MVTEAGGTPRRPLSVIYWTSLTSDHKSPVVCVNNKGAEVCWQFLTLPLCQTSPWNIEMSGLNQDWLEADLVVVTRLLNVWLLNDLHSFFKCINWIWHSILCMIMSETQHKSSWPGTWADAEWTKQCWTCTSTTESRLRNWICSSHPKSFIKAADETHHHPHDAGVFHQFEPCVFQTFRLLQIDQVPSTLCQWDSSLNEEPGLCSYKSDNENSDESGIPDRVPSMRFRQSGRDNVPVIVGRWHPRVTYQWES